jgi:putative lipoprotein
MRIAAALLCLVLVAAACGDDSNTDSAESAPSADSVSGVVTVGADAPSVDELPDDAVLTVSLEDITAADTDAIEIGQQQIDLAGQAFPIDFTVAYDGTTIVDSDTYRVTARVESGDTLLLVSDTVVPVITQGAPTTDLEVPLTVIAG